MPSIYGPIVTAPDIEDAVVATLQRWLDTMLGEVERQSDGRWGLRDIERPKTWEYVSDYTANDAQRRLPCIAVEAGPASRSYTGDGMVNMDLGLNVIVITKGNQRKATRETLEGLVQGVIMVLEKHGDLDGFAIGTVLGDDITRDAVTAAKAKTVAGARIPIMVLAQNVGSRWGGPEDPDEPEVPLPPTSPAYPDHLSTHVNVRGKDDPAPDAPSGDRAGANVSVVFSSAVAQLGESGTYRVRTDTRVIRFTLDCEGAPAGSPLTVEVRKNAATIIVAATIPAGSTTAQVLAFSEPVDTGDLLSVNVTSVGAGTPASGVTAQIDLGA